VGIQLIVRDSLAPVEFIDAAPDSCVDRFPVFQEPTILFLLGLQQTDQHFLDTAGAGNLELFLNSGLKGSVVMKLETSSPEYRWLASNPP
jgi:hypothetical protein